MSIGVELPPRSQRRDDQKRYGLELLETVRQMPMMKPMRLKVTEVSTRRGSSRRDARLERHQQRRRARIDEAEDDRLGRGRPT